MARERTQPAGCHAHAINSAGVSICLETFTFRDSDIGRRFRDALTVAARRGVCARLVVDAVGSFGLARDYFTELVAAGGAMRWFNELRLASFSFRDHRKLLVVDDIVFIGSSNLAPRSLRINFEIILRIQDATLAATARQQNVLFYRTPSHVIAASP